MIGKAFCKETFIAFAKLTTTISIEDAELGRCNLWHSNETKFTGKEVGPWKRRGLHNINDLLKETGGFISYDQ